MPIAELIKKLNHLNPPVKDEEIALRIGVNATTIYRWKNGLTKPHKIFEKEIEKILKEKK